jgi:hypothetical protein
VLDLLHREGAVISSEYTEEGIAARVIIKPEHWSRLKQFARERGNGDLH